MIPAFKKLPLTKVVMGTMIRGISAQKRLLLGFSSGFKRRLYYNVLCDSLILAVVCLLASNLLLLY